MGELEATEEVAVLYGPANSDPFHPSHIRRFFDLVTPLPDECWLWTGSSDLKGYGKFGAAYRVFPAHRYSYELLIGDVPPDMEMDHLCRMAECANPWHVEPVTMAENRRRTSVRYKLDPESFLYFTRGRSPTCKLGHIKSVMPCGQRYCRICLATRYAIKKQLRKGA